MHKISYKEFLDFLASDLNEVEYFGCNKTSLMSLKDYLLELKQKKEDFDKLISEPLKSIQNKNKWVKNIRPDRTLDENGLLVLGNTQPTFLLGIDPKFSNGNPEDYIRIGGYYVTPFLNLKMKNRTKLLENSQKELHEINKLANQLNMLEKPFYTVSGQFHVNPFGYDYCDIEGFCFPLIRIVRSTEKLKRVNPLVYMEREERETFYKKEGIYPKPLTLEERNKLVKKLYIKNNNK